MPNVNDIESTSQAESRPEEGDAQATAFNDLILSQPAAPLNANQPGSFPDQEDQKCETDRDRVSKELGITSTSFIGPVCRPELFEKELSDFYKELEQVGHEIDGDPSTTLVDPIFPPKSNTPVKNNSSDNVNGHERRGYRPYPDPHDHSGHEGENSKRWRPLIQADGDRLVMEEHVEHMWGHSPLQDPPGPRFQIPPPELYRNPTCHLDTRSRENFNSGGFWEPRRARDGYGRGFSSQGSPFLHCQRFNSDYRADHYGNWNRPDFVLILLRGLPGSGKSSLARELVSSGHSGLILSTDDFFFQQHRYVYEPALLGEAHDWNQRRAERAMSEGRSPIIIDNTNIQAWEMKPYVEMALDYNYRVDFLEPDTHWKYDPVQLEKWNKHGVPQKTIVKMLERFEWPVNIDIVMNSVEPLHKRNTQQQWTNVSHVP